MIYGSVCSGIEAATKAWHPLGWKPAFFSEIEKFPSAVLKHHYPDVPNHGDMSKFQEWPDHAIDLLVGGTPCQSFSVAGLRKGLDDPRGNLMLTYLAIARRYKPRWLVWENVPGVFSATSHETPDPCPPDIDLDGPDGPEDGQEILVTDEYEADETHAFSCLLSGFSELGYGFAYRTLDAQCVRTQSFPWAVPQRRRRVFVVGYLGDWRRAAAVLFDAESLRRDSPPRREAGVTVAALTSNGVGACGADDNQAQAGHLVAFGGNNSRSQIEVSTALSAHGGPYGRLDFESETFVAHTLRGEGFDAMEDGTGRGTPIVPVALTLRAGGNGTGGDRPYGTDVDTCESLVPIAIQERAVSENPDAGPDGVGVRDDGAAYTLEARQVPQAVAFDMRGRENGAQMEGPHDTANIRASSGGSSRSYVAEPWAMRRLTPRECERLQGFPDDFTRIPYRGKSPEQCPDGPRYKALGNSMAVNVMGWLGERIDAVEKMFSEINEK